MAIKDGFLIWTHNGKEMKLPYSGVKSAEVTHNGKVGKWTFQGFFEKPGQVEPKPKKETFNPFKMDDRSELDIESDEKPERKRRRDKDDE